MALKTKSIRGTRDVTPAESHKWQHIERVTLDVAGAYGFKEIRIPTIEKTELFVRSVGETTDVVQKEMYTFDKGRESITLRPEGTAGTVRAVLENGLLNDTLPQKLCYYVSCFRHENPQAGRLREHHQFGVECFGCPLPTADAEIIGVANDIFKRLGIGGLSLQINSIGCPDCRPDYNKKLVKYYKAHENKLCDTCKQRLERNPLRLLDCKEEACSLLAENAPQITGHLCGGCKEHFEGLQNRLDAMGIPFSVNPKIVRGLDYYTKTVFEFVSDNIGAKGTVCGGGRYDGLVGLMGGPETAALGFGMGIERLIMVMEAAGGKFPPVNGCDIYIGSMSEAGNIKALELCTLLRREGCAAICDTVGRSVKAQMKYADKINARFSCIIGEDELSKALVVIRDMQSGEARQCELRGEALRAVIKEADND